MASRAAAAAPPAAPGPPPAAPRLRRTSLALFALALSLYALAIVLRNPVLVFRPSFWAEEGTTYFAYAHAHGWLESLLHSPVDYLSLWTTLACTLAAKLVPLEIAPAITLLFSFAVQLAPAAIVLTSAAELWAGPARKLLGLLVLLLTLSSQEVWLNTINSQFFFALIAVIVLLEPVSPPSGRRSLLRALLLLGGLTGPVTCVLLPLFVWSWARERSRERGVQAVLLLLCALVQLVFIMFVQGESNRERVGSLDVFTLVSILWTRLALVFTGSANALEWSAILKNIHRFPTSPKLVEYVWSLLLLVEALLFAHLVAALPAKLRVQLFGSFALLFLAGVVFSAHKDKVQYINPLVAQRYSFVPNVLLLFMTIAALDFRARGRRLVRVGVALVLCASGLFHGAREYRTLSLRHRDGFPSWTLEVARWRQDGTYQPRIWPAGWTIDLGTEPAQ